MRYDFTPLVTGTGLLVYAAALLVASLLLVTSWAPAAIIVAASVVSFAYAGAGVAVIRQTAWQRAIMRMSCGLHVAVAVTWSAVLMSV